MKYSRESCANCGVESRRNVSYRGADGQGHALRNAAGTWQAGRWFCGQECVGEYWRSVHEADFLHEQWEREALECAAFVRRAKDKKPLAVERSENGKTDQ